MKQRKLGTGSTGAIALGAMRMSTENRPSEHQSIATIHAALDSGITLIDTADSYHRDAGEVGHNEVLIAKALAMRAGSASDVLVATKGGLLRPGDGTWAVDAEPARVKEAAKASARRLGTDTIDLYYAHRPDPAVPYSDSMGVLRELLDEGTIAMAGVSNVSVEQIGIARAILGNDLVAVQNRFSPAFRDSLPELALCTELGIAFFTWRPLEAIGQASPSDEPYAAFHRVAERYGVSPQRVCLAWQLALSPVVIPIPGSSRPESIADSAQADRLELTANDIAELSATSSAHP